MDLALKSKSVTAGIPRPIQPMSRGGASDRRNAFKPASSAGIVVATSRTANAPPPGLRPSMPQPMDLAKKTLVMSAPQLVSGRTDPSLPVVTVTTKSKIIHASPAKGKLVPLVLTPSSHTPMSVPRTVQTHVIHPVSGGLRPGAPTVTVATAGLSGSAIISPGRHISAVPIQIARSSVGTVTGLAIPRSLAASRIITSASGSGLLPGGHSSAPLGVLTRPALVASVSSEVSTRFTIGSGSFLPVHTMSGISTARGSQDLITQRPTKTVYFSAAPGASAVLPVSKVGVSGAGGASIAVTSGRPVVRAASQTVTLLTATDRNAGPTMLRPAGPLGLVLPDRRAVRFLSSGGPCTVVPAHVPGQGNQITLTTGGSRIAVASVTGLRTVPAIETRVSTVPAPSTSCTQTPAFQQAPGVTTVTLSPSASARLTLSPRPSILRKRDAESPGGSPAKRALLLTSASPLSPASITSSSNFVPSIISAMNSGASTSSAVQESLTVPDPGRGLSPVDGDSNSSSTLSATSSRGADDFGGGRGDYFDEDRLDIDESRSDDDNDNDNDDDDDDDDDDEDEDQDTEAPSFHSRLAEFIKTEPGGASPSYESFAPDEDSPYARTPFSTPGPDSPYSYDRSPTRHGSDSSAGPSGYYSPRKKPRKQHLQGMDFSDESGNRGDDSDAAVDLSGEFSRPWPSEEELLDPSEIKEEADDDVFETFSERKLRNKRLAPSDESVQRRERAGSLGSECKTESDWDGRTSMLSTYRCWWNPRANHYLKRSDVKVREERKPGIHELCSQKLIERRAEGYALIMIDRHVDDLETDEETIQKSLLRLVTRWEKMDRRFGPKAGYLRELAMANYQRSLLVQQQLRDVRDNLIGIINHRAPVVDLIRKYAVKPRTSCRKREK